MGFVIPVGIKEVFEQLEKGYILFKIENVAAGDLAKQDDPKGPVFGFVADLIAEEPSEMAGITREERFYLGIREGDGRVTSGRAKVDPMCESDDTLILTLGKFKQFAQAAGVEIEGKETDMIFSELKNRTVIGKVEHKFLPARPGETQSDKPFAQINRWLPVNAGVEPHMTPNEAVIGAAGKAPATAGPQPTRAAAPAPAAPKAAAPAGRPTPQRLGARTANA